MAWALVLQLLAKGLASMRHTSRVAVAANAGGAPDPAFYVLGGVALWFTTHARKYLRVQAALRRDEPRLGAACGFNL